MTVRSNPRILILFLIIAAMFAVSILGFVFSTAVLGIIFLAIALFLSYQFLRFARSHLRSRIVTDDAGITFHMPTNEQEHFDWGELALTGLCTQAKGKPFAFVYSRDRDRLITVPREYERFDELLGGLKEHVDYGELDLAAGVTIQQKLRELLGIPEPTEDEVEPDNGEGITGSEERDDPTAPEGLSEGDDGNSSKS